MSSFAVIPLKYSLFLVLLILKTTQFHQVSAKNKYITSHKCVPFMDWDCLKLTCSDQQQNKSISTASNQSVPVWNGCDHFYIQRVEFANCELDVLPNQLLENLTLLELDMSSISLVSMKPADLPVINYAGPRGKDTRLLNLSSNHLTHIEQPMFREQRTLNVLDLSVNRIASLSSDALVGLTALNILNLQWNNLSEIANGTFTPLSNLNILNLSHNQLKQLNDAIFRNLTQLRALDL